MVDAVIADRLLFDPADIDTLTVALLNALRAHYLANDPARRNVVVALEALATTTACVIAGTHPDHAANLNAFTANLRGRLDDYVALAQSMERE